MVNQPDIKYQRNFPFRSFDEFKTACVMGTCQAIANLNVMDDWLAGRWDEKPSLWISTRTFALKHVPVLINLCILVYGLASKRWLLCSVIPLTYLVLLTVSPMSQKPKRLFRLLIICLLLACLLWSVALHDLERTLVISALLVSWLAQKCAFENSAKTFFYKIFSDADFCASAWHRNAFVIRLADEACAVEISQSLDEDVSGPSAGIIEVSANLNTSNVVEVTLEPSRQSMTSSTELSGTQSDAHSVLDIELRAMRIAMRYERMHGRQPEDCSMYYVGYDIRSGDAARSAQRAIEVKGKATLGGIILTSNEWKTAGVLGDNYFLYVIENVYSSKPRIKIIQNPYKKLQPSIKKRQYKITRRTYASRADGIDIRLCKDRV